jgi:hypothetical protein
MSNATIAVITSSIGTNNLITPEKWLDKVDYHAFVEPHQLSVDDMWHRHEYVSFSLDPKYKNRRDAKIYKICPHLFLPGYDYYIWMDATHTLEADPEELIEEYLKGSEIAVFQHPERDCVYEEAELVKQIGFDHANLIEDQLDFYREMEYPEHNGLYELPARIQKNNGRTKQLGLMWWEQICMFSSRDQISFPFVCEQLNIKPNIIPGRANTIRGNKYIPQVISSHHSRVG